MRFLVDAQLPPGLARHLTALGHEAEHVLELGLAGATDSEIWAHAIRVGAIVISKDGDFAARARDPQSRVQVVWIRLGNATNTALWRALGARFSEIVDALTAGERLVEIV